MNEALTKIPLPKEEIIFHFPQINQINLDERLNIFFIRKEKLPIIQLNLLIESGSKFDSSEKLGTNNLLASLIDEGADGLTGLEINDKLDSLGSDITIYNNHDFIYFNLTSLSENFPQTLEILSKIIFKPDFSERDFIRERNKTETYLTQILDDAEELADKIFEKIVYDENTFYGLYTLGNLNSIKNLNNDDIKISHQNNILKNKFNFSIVGNIDENNLSNLLYQNYFSFLKDKEKINEVSNKEFLFKLFYSTHKIYIYNKKDSTQTEIRIGHLTEPRTENNFLSRNIVNTILGGQFSSRINLNLREKHGFTYGARSFFDYKKLGGHFEISTSVSIDNTGEAVDEILKEMNLIRENITNEELEFAKSSLIRRYPLTLETYPQIASMLNTKIIFNLSNKYFEDYINNIKNIELKEVQDAAKKYIHPENSLIVLVGDKEKIINSLIKMNLNNFIEVDEEGNEIT
ncbi:MAG: hypothetical protein STSR0008_17020 [Ignavibacterium sp.]